MLYLPPDPKPGQPVRAETITAILKYLRQITPRTSSNCDVQPGAGGVVHKPKYPQKLEGLLSNNSPVHAWKVYNTSQGGAGQVQINGGDGKVASLLDPTGTTWICQVNGTDNDQGPPYPQLSVSGNGVIYGYAELNTVSGAPPTTSITSLNAYYAGSMPGADTNNPAGYIAFLLATISGFASIDGKVSFQVNDALDYGYSNLQMCGGLPYLY